MFFDRSFHALYSCGVVASRVLGLLGYNATATVASFEHHHSNVVKGFVNHYLSTILEW